MSGNSYKGKKVAILGYAVEGKSAYSYYKKLGADITIYFWQNDGDAIDLPSGVKSKEFREGEAPAGLDEFDLIVRGPAVLPYNVKTSKPITSVMNEFLAVCQGLVIGVTGTKGKGTVSSLIHHILKTAGKDAYLGGNIGVPPLDFVDELTGSSITVLEMSNLQLWDIKQSPQVAVLLHLAPEHLDWHKSLAEYYATKANITKFQSERDLLIYNAANSVAVGIAGHSKAKKLPYLDTTGVFIEGNQIKYKGETVINTANIPLIGEHNYGNVCAAVAATWELISDKSRISEGIATYKGLAHRLELVAEKAGAEYYDDSIATHQDAAVAAIRAFPEPKVLILGGSDKGTEFDLLIKEVISSNQTVRSIILVGQMASKIKQLLLSAGFEQSKLIENKADMSHIVAAAADVSKPGDVVLLSPACASFDMFKGYADRGDQFKKAVLAL